MRKPKAAIAATDADDTPEHDGKHQRPEQEVVGHREIDRPEHTVEAPESDQSGADPEDQAAIAIDASMCSSMLVGRIFICVVLSSGVVLRFNTGARSQCGTAAYWILNGLHIRVRLRHCR